MIINYKSSIWTPSAAQKPTRLRMWLDTPYKWAKPHAGSAAARAPAAPNHHAAAGQHQTRAGHRQESDAEDARTIGSRRGGGRRYSAKAITKAATYGAAQRQAVARGAIHAEARSEGTVAVAARHHATSTGQLELHGSYATLAACHNVFCIYKEAGRLVTPPFDGRCRDAWVRPMCPVHQKR